MASGMGIIKHLEGLVPSTKGRNRNSGRIIRQISDLYP